MVNRHFLLNGVCRFQLFAGAGKYRDDSHTGGQPALLRACANVAGLLPAQRITGTIALLLVVFISGIYSDDKTSWLNWVRIKLPCLALPLAFAPLARLDDKKFRVALGGFILIFFISSSITLVHYLLNFQAITESINRGNALGMPLNSHIRYTIMLAFSFFCCIYLLTPYPPLQDLRANAIGEWEPVPILNKKVRWLLITAAVFVFVALHMFTVRSGLVALYLGGLYLSLHEIFRRKKIFIGLGLICIILLAPLAAYKFVPSFQNKLNYMKYDLERYQVGDINNNSDAMRLASMKAGIKIWEQHKLIGAGAGDLRNECAEIYKTDYPQIAPENYRLPHNQFIWILATTGIIGLAAFLLAFLYPLFVNGNYKHWLFVVLHLSAFLLLLYRGYLRGADRLRFLSCFPNAIY